MPQAPETFPQADLIFQMSTLRGEGENEGLGFVNADGSGLSHLTVLIPNVWGGESPPVLPIIAPDASMVIFRGSTSPHYAGDLIVWTGARPALKCKVDPGSHRPSFTSDYDALTIDLVSPGGRVGVYELVDCLTGGKARMTTPFSVLPPKEILEGALSPRRSLLAFAQWDRRLRKFGVAIHNLDTGEQVDLGEGIAPAWSPDGQMLAFLGLDGVYVAQYDGNSIRRVSPYRSPDSGDRPVFVVDWPPLPSWSPDGHWLVYHKCILPPAPTTDCGSSIDDYAIFKVNVDTGEEIKILDGGLNPYWRWKAPQP
jgi:hypothetical protein